MTAIRIKSWDTDNNFFSLFLSLPASFYIEYHKMASNDERSRLIDSKIVKIADKISKNDMEQLAVGYLGISHETVRNLRDEDPAAFTREILRLYRNENPDNDITVSICFFNDLHHFFPNSGGNLSHNQC